MTRVPRLYVPGRLAPGLAVLNSDQSRRLADVVRLREGDEFRLFNGDGKGWKGVLT